MLVKRAHGVNKVNVDIDGLMQGCSISRLQCISNGDTAVLHQAIDNI